MSLEERSTMIECLVQRLPYNRAWYAGLKDDKLIALYLQHRSDPIIDRRETEMTDYPVVHRNPMIRTNPETGENEIQADSGEWVQIYD